MRSLGADVVVDYRVADPTRLGPFDLVLDLVAHRSKLSWRRALARGGRYFLVGGAMSALLGGVTVGPLIGALSGRRLGVLFVRQGPAGFEPVAELCARGRAAPPDRSHLPARTGAGGPRRGSARGSCSAKW